MSENEDLPIEEPLTDVEIQALADETLKTQEKDKPIEKTKQDDSEKDLAKDVLPKDFQASDLEVETDGDFEYVDS